jgi:hypothetical protein
MGNVALYLPCPLMSSNWANGELGMVEWRTQTLHCLVKSLITAANIPALNPHWTIDLLKAELLKHGKLIEPDMKKHDLATELGKVYEAKPVTWHDVIGLVEAGDVVSLTLVFSAYQHWRQVTGMEGYCVGTARNPPATRHLIKYIDFLYEREVTNGAMGFPADGGDIVQFRNLIFDLDAMTTEHGIRAFRLRVPEAELDAAIANPDSYEGEGVDIRRWLTTDAIDHGRKKTMRDCYALACGGAKPGLNSLNVPAVQEQARAQMRVADENEFASGAKLDAMLHQVMVTFVSCHPAIQMTLLLADRSGLSSKMHMASRARQDDRPEMLCNIKPSESGFALASAAENAMNYKTEIVVSHFVVFALHLMLRVTSTKVDIMASQYKVGAALGPFFNTELRQQGLGLFYFSDFMYETLMQPVRRYFRDHGFFINMLQIGKASRNQVS